MLSSGVVPGTVQVPPTGQPIVLMGDAQTTGGYPRIGAVIRADLWTLAQAPLGGMLRLVKSLNLSWQKTQPSHPKADAAAQERFKKGVSLPR